jgi:hypothetical protein
VELGPLFGYRYQRISQDIVDYQGWQIDISSQPYTRHEIGGDELALTYRVSYHLPLLGINAEVGDPGSVSGALQAAMIPFSFSDVDDHVLRNKIATCSGTGFGYLVVTDTEWQLRGGEETRRLALAFSFELLSLSGDGDQTQRWYGDDPASPQTDDTGTVYHNIPHEVDSTQYRLGVSVGMAF